MKKKRNKTERTRPVPGDLVVGLSNSLILWRYPENSTAPFAGMQSGDFNSDEIAFVVATYGGEALVITSKNILGWAASSRFKVS